MIALSSEKKFLGIGLMSGTSVDGLDISACFYEKKNDKYQYKILEAITINYSNIWKSRLLNAENLSGRALQELHIDFARFCAEQINMFIKRNNLEPDFIASHGHTIFHQPKKGYTLQIGCGATIAALTGITTVSDFRQMDVALGGQGAPLVPIGDLLLFTNYDVCINLGGFANISVKENGNIMAYDICPVNIVLNELCGKLNLPYDDQGNIAKSAEVNLALLEALNKLEFYQQKAPKSLGTEWVRSNFNGILHQFENVISVQNCIATITMHAATQIAAAIPAHSKNILLTGGGALNKYLINCIQEKTRAHINVPELNVIHYKEAVIFGFLGFLRLNNEINVLQAVTGAKTDSSSGVIHLISS
jgi:anhydro-N-acetylmuramic acid kinase